jgi:hypothetical protein
MLQKVWDLLATNGPKVGLHLNPAKCEWSWLDSSCSDPCPISVSGRKEDKISLVPTDEIQMLGVPLGSSGKVAEYVEKKLFSKLGLMVDRLCGFDDSQSAFFLLRVSFSIVRATHFMRTTPLAQWTTQATEFDAVIRNAAENILGFRLSDQCYAQACLTPRLGGLGLRRVVDHADIAFSASWHESKLECAEPWTDRTDVGFVGVSQKKGSFDKDDQILKRLVSEAPNGRERQRLRRLTCDHAGAWISAVPSVTDGQDTVMKPRNFQVSAKVRLGVPVLKQEVICSLCKQTVDVLGDHAACCAKTSDLVHRHNRLRNLVDKICTEGNLAPVMEKKGILGDTPGRRPGDVTVPLWANGKGLAIDVAVTCPFASHNISMESPCENYADKKKHRKYDASFAGSNYDFAAMVFETTGGLNDQGLQVLRQLFRFAARQENLQLSVYCGRAWARLSCNLQSSVSQAILNRIDGVPVDSCEDEGSDILIVDNL